MSLCFGPSVLESVSLSELSLKRIGTSLTQLSYNYPAPSSFKKSYRQIWLSKVGKFDHQICSWLHHCQQNYFYLQKRVTSSPNGQSFLTLASKNRSFPVGFIEPVRDALTKNGKQPAGWWWWYLTGSSCGEDSSQLGHFSAWLQTRLHQNLPAARGQTAVKGKCKSSELLYP